MDELSDAVAVGDGVGDTRARARRDEALRGPARAEMRAMSSSLSSLSLLLLVVYAMLKYRIPLVDAFAYALDQGQPPVLDKAATVGTEPALRVQLLKGVRYGVYETVLTGRRWRIARS